MNPLLQSLGPVRQHRSDKLAASLRRTHQIPPAPCWAEIMPTLGRLLRAAPTTNHAGIPAEEDRP